MTGDDCAIYKISHGDGAKFHETGEVVDMTEGPASYTKDGAIMNRGECLQLVGKGTPAEDPKAPGPSGATVTVSELVDRAVAGRSKWDGKQLAITGTIKQGGSSILLADTTDKAKTVWVTLAAGATAPELGTAATFHCTVKINSFVTGAGQPGMEPGLDACSVP